MLDIQAIAVKAASNLDVKTYGDLSTLPLDKLLDFSVHSHDSQSAGLHDDIRFGVNKHFSFATKEGLPEVGGKSRLYQTKLHPASFSNLEGTVVKKRTGDVVTSKLKGKIRVLNASSDKLSFSMGDGDEEKRFTLIRAGKPSGNKKTWVLVNNSKVHDSQVSEPTNSENDGLDDDLTIDKEATAKEAAVRLLP